MASITSTVVFCDKCKTELPHHSSVAIVTSVSEGNSYWDRLHLTIKRHHGVNNNGNKDDADLCQTCTIFLLTDALQRVQAGERASKGTQGIGQKGWERD